MVWKSPAKREQRNQRRREKSYRVHGLHQEKLFASLKYNDLKIFKKYIEYNEKYASMVESHAFEIGFKLAVKLLTE